MGIRFKLFLPIFLAFAALAGVLHFYWVPEQLLHVKDDVTKSHAAVLSALTPGLGKSLLVRDLAAVHATLNQQIESNADAWKQLVLRNNEGRRLYPLAEPLPAEGAYLIELSSAVSLGGANIAWIDLVLDWSKERRDSMRWAQRFEFIMLAIFAVIVSIAFVWQNRWIRLPLIRLQSATGRMSAGDFEADMPQAGDDELGKLTQAFGGMQDNLKSAQWALQQALTDVSDSETRLRTILNAVADAIIVINKTGKIESINPAAEKMFGYSYGEAVGRDVSDFLPEDDSGNPEDYITSPDTDNAGAILQQPNLFGLRRSGESFPVEISFAPVETIEGGYIVAVLRDISARKQAENALLEAKNEAENASQAKSEFLSHMSHELRTPLNAILGFSQLLVMELKNQNDSENAAEIVKAGGHLLSLINEVLDLSRIESGKMELSIETVRLNDTVNDCLTLIGPMADEREIKLIDHISTKSDLNVCVDFNRLKQVLLNLMSNAVKYNCSGGSVTLDCQKTDLGQLRISVTDTGKGLTEAQQAYLFSPFERAGADKSNIEGAGIGLVITKHLVELMGGQIGFESKPGQGSCFWFDVNLDAKGTPKAAIINRDDGELVNQSDARTILYVEDNPANLRLVSHLIKVRTPYVLLSAPDASLGLSLAQAHKPDLILMDINLPGMNGFEAMVKLQEDEETRHIPVIAVTANAMRKDIEMGRKAGFRAYLTKPFDVAELVAEIDKAVGG